MSHHEIKALYDFYWEIKATVAVYEVTYNKIPADLVNELRNAFDHVARCYVLYGLDSDKIQDDFVTKHLTLARNHLKRLHLDLHKNILLYLHDKTFQWVEVIQRQVQLIGEHPYPLPAVVKFQQEFHEKRVVAEQVVIEAKQRECQQQNHDDKVVLLKNAEGKLKEFHRWTNEQYYQILPIFEEAFKIAKKDKIRYRISTYLVPAIALILGLLLAKLFSC